jgi:hypothetical protein
MERPSVARRAESAQMLAIIRGAKHGSPRARTAQRGQSSRLSAQDISRDCRESGRSASRRAATMLPRVTAVRRWAPLALLLLLTAVCSGGQTRTSESKGDFTVFDR